MHSAQTSPRGDFKARLQQTYDAHADERDRSDEAAWRWPLCEQLISLLRSEKRDRLLEIGPTLIHSNHSQPSRARTEASPGSDEGLR